METQIENSWATIKILLVEDDADFNELHQRALGLQKNPRFETVSVDRLENALKQIEQSRPDIILLDLKLPDSEGLETFIRIQSQNQEIPIIILSGINDESLALEAVRRGAQDYLVKGEWDSRHLIRSLRHAIERQHIKKELDSVTNQLIAANERLKILALLDPLTELYNRRGLQRILSREISWAHRSAFESLVLLLDLDDFKMVNDTFGHGVGDIILKEISQKLKIMLRASDYIARIGGDEFMILLTQTSMSEGLRVAEKIRLAISETPIVLASGKAIRVTASLGVAKISKETTSIDELLAATHPVLYTSKHTGKNQVSSEVSIRNYVLKEDKILQEALTKLHTGEGFRSVRQPILRLKDRQIIAYEFLTRSTINTFEMPEHFFQICHEQHMLPFVDHRCLKCCVTAAASLPHGIRAHINVFPSTIIDIPPDHILESFPSEKPTSSFCIEISEQQIIGEPSYLASSVNAFKEAGILIGVDDVGFGHSSLESLILLEPHIIKIDKKYVRGVAYDRSQTALLKRLLKIAECLGAEVIAEGIESEEDLRLLLELGVEYGQGFLLGVPT